MYGIGGYNSRAWDDVCPFAKSARLSDRGNIWASAWILAYYKSISSNTLESLKRYKGYCYEGACRARTVIRIKDGL